MKLNTSSTKIKGRPANDVFFTPESLSRDLISSVPIEDLDLCLDPFKGQGAFFNNLPSPSVWCEIEEGRDFFDFDSQVDWIISNPPFSMISKTLEHSMKICRKGFGYILPSYALTMPRIEMVRKEGFSVSKIVYFRVPKCWNFGFASHFVLFTKNASSDIRIIEEVFE